jgi:hypothetical protein
VPLIDVPLRLGHVEADHEIGVAGRLRLGRPPGERDPTGRRQPGDEGDGNDDLLHGPAILGGQVFGRKLSKMSCSLARSAFQVASLVSQ